MKLEILAFIALGLAAIPCGLFLVNLWFYRRTPPFACDDDHKRSTQNHPPLSVLIPARNEEPNIGATLSAVLANRGIGFEVIVLNDHSTDRTADIVQRLSINDARVRLESAPPLPVGWCGKQHACHVLAQRAKNPLLVFMDADVLLTPDALARMAEFMRAGRTRTPHTNQLPAPALASGVPHQELGTFSERLLIPLIHFVLLGYLPMFMMRWTSRAAFSAGCGQLFIAWADDYRATGGHAQIRATLHDGVKLPRLFRTAGFRTELFDATDIATCRMYKTNGAVWRGLGKNATEGLASPGVILPMTVLLLGGQILPFVLLTGAVGFSLRAITITLAAGALAFLPRLLSIWKFRQPFGSAILHPLGVLALVSIQWMALVRRLRGKPAEWKGRSYMTNNIPQPADVA